MQLYSLFNEVYSINLSFYVFVFMIIVASIIHYAMKTSGLPPGPMGLPYIGYWPFFNPRTIHLQLENLKKKYGDIFSFTCFGRLFVNLGTIKLVREAYLTKSDYFRGRYDDHAVMNVIFKGAVLVSNDEAWRTLRKFFVLTFKELGVLSVKDSMSTGLYDSVKSIINNIRSANGKPVDITEMMSVKSNSILRHVLLAESGVTDEQLLEIGKSHEKALTAMQPKNAFLMGNLARFLIYPFKSEIKIALEKKPETVKLLLKLIEDRKAIYDEEHVRNIIDAYLKERNKRQRNGDPTAKHFTDEALVANLVQFLGDGALTVATYVAVFLKNIVERPEEQEKVYQEIIEVIGEERDPTMDDKPKLTYTNAFILEVQRLSEFAQLIPSLECTTETTLAGYRIPKGAIAVTNIYSSHFDSHTYEEPEKFNPSRFISKEGKPKPESPILFGVGKRSCLGESYVLMQTFLFLTTIVKHFHLSPAKGNLDSVFEIVHERCYLVHAEPRKKIMH